MEKLETFVAEVLNRYKDPNSITDSIFLMIQNDRTLMKKYLELVEQEGLNKVNQNIGKQVKKQLGLENSGERNFNPISTLIQSNTILK
ncbi:MAG: hypothetical protein IKO90_10625 [Bacteroidales bacterium]|nr:hypothetical protein [Bacteroidales bacterium]MBR4690898.1 hypothetical protein [Bacteroidales bacterium]